MLNFFISNALETVPIFTFFLENSCRNSFTHSVKPSSATAAHRHLSVDYIIIRFFPRHSTAAVQHYFYRFFKTFPDGVFCSWKFCHFVLSKQWIKWDLIFEVLNLASIGDLWCDKKWMLLQRRRSQLHLTVAELAKQ